MANLANCFGFLNYIAFFILYVISFIFISRTYSEIVGFGALFVVHSAFTVFIAKELFTKFNSIVLPNFGTIIIILSIIIGLLFHFIALILILIMIRELQVKYTAADGTPMHLSDKNNDLLDDFKKSMYTVFAFIFGLLIMVFHKNELLNEPFAFNINDFTKSFPRLLSILIAFTVMGLSSNQVVIANVFSKQKQKDLIR